MLDHLIRGATVVDGTGAPPRSADVGIRGGRIVAIAPPGEATELARSSEDATGLVLTPGFVDPHTHYDAQLFWDPFATPSMNHGVTTIAGGNCGFTLAPLKPEDADYTRRMMSKVEGMSLKALEDGVDWTWESFGDYLTALEGRGIAVNAGFMVGHCALRRHVMGPEAVGGQPSAAQLDAMLSLFHASMDAGGWGLSTTQSSTHSDGDGRPVASRHARPAELLALSRAVGEHEGTQIEAIVAGCLDQFSDDEIDLFVEMSATAGRPLNWNVLTIDATVPQRVPRQLLASERARKAGGRIVALTMPILTPMNMSLGTFCALNLIPGWGEVLSLPVPERIARLRDETVRTEMLRRADSPEAGVFRRLADFGRYVIGDTYSQVNKEAGVSGRVVRDIAAERGQEPFHTLVEICANDDLRTVLWPMPTDNDPDSWELRRRTWEHEDVMLGGSDAGAHLDRMCGAPYTTRFLGDCLRGRKLVSLARAVRMLTDDPARLFGLRGRGRIAEGYHADLVLFDPERIDAGVATLVHDLPGDSPRLDARGQGVVSVRVNGVETIRDDAITGAIPGTVLRSGRDTETVSTTA
jgi:N-acyl-D-aspartate/D-glutamate deacylase